MPTPEESKEPSLTMGWALADVQARKALWELELATIDLKGAEARHHIALAQLQKAEEGVLGIEQSRVL